MRIFLALFVIAFLGQSAWSLPLEIEKKASVISPAEPIRMSAEKECSFKVKASCTDSDDRAYDTNYSFDLGGIEFKLEGYSQARSSYDYYEELSGAKLHGDNF